ncbi:MAG TPA: rod shape-determining protein RodA [Gammaproteobacteria bacterium]|nr:rod shape-determining protein RodA [Gammaproteobacteria bacterium]HET7588250.1 rod shape-determining protein RodA [Gammaproteobacteria bacterium]
MNVNIDAIDTGQITPGQWVARALKLDLPLFAGLVALSGAGLTILYSASGPSMDLVMRQGIRIGIAFVVLLVAAQIKIDFYRLWAPWLYFAGVGLLVAVLHFGDIGMGARRWLDLGFIRFEPSEIMKLALPMMVGWYLHSRPLPPDWRTLIASLVFVMVPVALIARQPDLGTSLLVLSSGCFGVFLAGLRWRTILLFALVAAIAAPIMWFFFMHDYQQQRLLTFLNPERDPLGAGYHIIQSKIAIGSGGIFGKGWLNGTQAQLNFLPEQTTDFIFSVVCEEFGLLGAGGLLLIYAFIIGRGLYIAVQARDTFSRLLAGSITLTFFVYVFVNTGMVSGLLPVVGVPLPLVSYGGTSMVTLMGGFGILMSVQAHRKFMPS